MFISLEGADGSGKTTQVALLANRLQAENHDVEVTREPGGTPGAEAVARLLLDGATDRWSAMTEVLLFAAARRDHVERKIRPALDRGAIVISDRFHDSTAVYQSARGADPAEIEIIHNTAVAIRPDLTLVLQVDANEAGARLQARSEGEYRFERMGSEFHRRVARGYRALCEQEPERCQPIDGDGSAESVSDAIWSIVAPRLAG